MNCKILIGKQLNPIPRNPHCQLILCRGGGTLTPLRGIGLKEVVHHFHNITFKNFARISKLNVLSKIWYNLGQ